MEYLQKEYREAKDNLRRSFEEQILTGIEYEGKIKYRIFGSAETLKWMVDNNRLPGKLVYVGRVKFDGEEPTLEEINLSQVKYKTLKLTEKGRRLLEKQIEKRRQRLVIKNSNRV